MFESMVGMMREQVTQTLSLVEMGEDGKGGRSLMMPGIGLPNDVAEGRNDPASQEKSTGKVTPFAQRPKVKIDAQNPDTWGRVKRNADCPCGSGKKYKHCHGSIKASA
jgi:preprotein translocase subunit SecA